MAHAMREIGRITRRTVREHSRVPMAKSSMGNGLTTSRTATAYSPTAKVQDMRVTGRMISSMERVSSIGLMVLDTRDNTRMDLSQVPENTPSATGQHIRDSGLRTR